jgi:hypothetical protein
MKYLMFENDLNGIFPIAFSETSDHGEMARCFKHIIHTKPTSAGYCNHNQTWGDSKSLKITAQPGDEIFIQQLFLPKPGRSDAKYLTMAVPCGGTTQTIIFPAMLDHGAIAKAIQTEFPGLEVQGAGFLSLTNGKATPHGASVSLQKGVHADDDFYISRQFESLDIS